MGHFYVHRLTLLFFIALTLTSSSFPTQRQVCNVLNSSCQTTPLAYTRQICLNTTTQDQVCHLDVSAPTSTRLLTSEIKTTSFSDENPVNKALFGPARHMVGSSEEFKPYTHPRILMNETQWEQLINNYADPALFKQHGTWSSHMYWMTSSSPVSPIIMNLVDMERSGYTASYDGRAYDGNSPAYIHYRQGLAHMASNITIAHPHNLEVMFFCALWARVAEVRWKDGYKDFYNLSIGNNCIDAVVAWAKIVLAHHQFHCTPLNPHCKSGGMKEERTYIWDTTHFWGLHIDWYTGGAPMALVYDFMYAKMTESQRTTIRSAIALSVMNRFSWGTAKETSIHNPNVLTDPHRIFSNWAAYNGHLYVINLAIEGENKFDDYVTSILRLEKKTSGFNKELDVRYAELLKKFMDNSFYPDGATFEDAYSYNNAMREGSIALLASERRGSKVLSRARFRNAIHNLAQMTEPWHCGNFIGHSSGGGSVYNAHITLFRYVYPHGELPGMLLRQRFGDHFVTNNPCRTTWYQSAMQQALLGGEHSSSANAPQDIRGDLKKYFPLSVYSPRRGLLIARSTLSENATYIHFDCRPDAFLVGHDNADRGVYTFTTQRQTWVDDLQWNWNVDSNRHSLMHIDNIGEGLKAPSCNVTDISDEGGIVLGTADITYAYNTQWSPDRSGKPFYRRYVTKDPTTGAYKIEILHFDEPENNSPWDLGWPADDRAADLGFHDGMGLSNVSDIGFGGLWYWKRPSRPTPLKRMMRSVALLRKPQSHHAVDPTIFVVVDSVDAGPGEHNFTSYVMLHKSVVVNKTVSSCNGGECRLLLQSGNKRVALHAMSTKSKLSYRADKFDKVKPRIVFFSEGGQHEELWMAYRGVPEDTTRPPMMLRRPGRPGFLGARFGTMAVDNSFLVVEKGRLRSMTAGEHASQPPLPIWLTAWRKRRLTSRDLVANPQRFLIRKPGTTHEFMGVIYGAADGRWGLNARDVVDTCLAGTRSWISVLDCGTTYEERTRRWKTRACTPVRKDVTMQSCTTGGSRWIGKLMRFRAYYVVVGMAARGPPALVVRHETLQGQDTIPIVLPSASTLTELPPPLREVLFGKTYWFGPTDFERRPEHFYDRGGMDGQLAVRFRSTGSETGNAQDAVMTCSSNTMAGVEMAVFDCGNETRMVENYQKRACELVDNSAEWDRCHGFRARIKSNLVAGRWYIAVVSAYDRGEGLAIELKHLLSYM